MMLVVENLLRPQEIAALRETLKRARFESGTKTGKKVLKNNVQADKADPEVQRATRALVARLYERQEFTSFAIPRNLVLMFNRYDPGMTYRDHMDAALMGPSQREALRSDLSFTVFLTDPSEYEGGEFVLQSPFGEQRIKHAAGTLMCYPSNMLHRVDPVTRGARWSAVGWIQSFVRDGEKRQLIWQLDRLRHRMARELPPDSPFPEEFAFVHQNLLRMWAEV